MPYIQDFDLHWRGWGFPAVTCGGNDPDAVCALTDGFRDPRPGDDWLKPKSPRLFDQWQHAGKPRDPESLSKYGAEQVEDRAR